MAWRKQQNTEDHPSHWIAGAAICLMVMIALPEARPLSGPLFFFFLLGWPISQARYQRRKARTLLLQDLQTLSPRELEVHVAQVIGELPGWRAEATRGSADQGADVIATAPSGVRVAIQVKHYRNNVGNKAVQEIVASKAFYRCAHAVVFTSGPGYTKAAQELARANSVPLWGPSDLFRVQELAQAGKAPPATLLPA